MLFRSEITTILGHDLKSRLAVKDLLLYIQNTGSKEVVVDFTNAQFATRSFIDEYYNVIMKNALANIKIETINIPEDIQAIFDAVKQTQHKTKSIKVEGTVIRCATMEDVRKVFTTLLL